MNDHHYNTSSRITYYSSADIKYAFLDTGAEQEK
jgi:hypothetical protein